MCSAVDHACADAIPARALGLRPILPALGGLVLFALAANVPFIDQAFHMDDGIYLLIARNVRHDPWFPQDMPVYFEGLYGRDLASTEHPWPLTSYLLSALGGIGGFSEWCLHLGFLVFPMVLACSMFSIAGRFTRHPCLAALTLMALPIVFVASHTLMTDVPLLALWLASMALFMRGVLDESAVHVWLGTLVAALALLVSYSGLCLVLLLSLYGILRGARKAALLAIIVPVSVLGFWVAVTYLHYRRFAPGLLIGSYLSVKHVLSPGLLGQKAAYVASCLGGATVFPGLLIVLGGKRSILAGLLIAVAAGSMIGVPELGLMRMAALVVFLSAGLTATIAIIGPVAGSPAVLKNNRPEVADDRILRLWFAGVVVFCVVAYMTGSARYLLPAAPPLILMLFRRLEGVMDPPRLRLVLYANLVYCCLLALALAVADYQFAGVYREFARTLERSHPKQGGKSWFTGEWGLRAYLEVAGGQELGRRDARPAPGDLLVVPTLATPYDTLYSDRLSLESTVLIAPSSVTFDVPPVTTDSVLILTLGMPFYDKSDGMDFAVRFISGDGARTLHKESLAPVNGGRWRVLEIPLKEIAGKPGGIQFAACVGRSGNADADWLAIARARICDRCGGKEAVLCDVREGLRSARVESPPGVSYHTDRNLSIFSMTVWLDQEPATLLRGRYEYRPAFPLRTMDLQRHAGFWSSAWGLLPFSFAAGRPVLESLSVYEITRKVDAYGDTTPSWYEQ